MWSTVTIVDWGAAVRRAVGVRRVLPVASGVVAIDHHALSGVQDSRNRFRPVGAPAEERVIICRSGI